MKNIFTELSFRVRILLLLAVILLIVNLPIFYVNALNLQVNHKEITHGQNFRFAATHFLSSLSELEILHRDYLLAPTAAKMGQFETSEKIVIKEMKKLSDWSYDNNVRSQSLKGIENRMKLRLAFLKTSLQDHDLRRIRESSNDDLAKIRQKVDDINHDENLLLADSQRKIDHENLNFRTLLLSLGLLDLGMLLFAILVLQSEYNSKIGFGKKLNDLQIRYRTMVDNAPVIFWAVAKNEKFSVFEGQGLELAGFDQGEVIGQSYGDVFQDPAGILALKKALKSECAKQDIQVRGRWYETVYVPDLQKGEVCGVVGMSLDITSRKLGEEDARKGNEAKSRFLANMSTKFELP